MIFDTLSTGQSSEEWNAVNSIPSRDRGWKSCNHVLVLS